MPRSDRLLTIMVASVAALVLSGCGGRSDGAEKAAVIQPPLPPLPLAPADTVTPVLEPGEANMEARIARLEETVNTLRSDYDRIMPAFASLNTTNQRIQALLDQMEGGEKPLAPQSPSMTSVPEKAVAASKLPAANPLSPTSKTTAEPVVIVTGIRIGEHADKTRLVLDLKAETKPEFSYDIDNAEKFLLIELAGMDWKCAAKGMPKSPMIVGWSVQTSVSGGMAVAVELKKPAKIISSQYLKAEGKDPARLVLDIAPDVP